MTYTLGVGRSGILTEFLVPSTPQFSLRRSVREARHARFATTVSREAAQFTHGEPGVNHRISLFVSPSVFTKKLSVWRDSTRSFCNDRVSRGGAVYSQRTESQPPNFSFRQPLSFHQKLSIWRDSTRSFCNARVSRGGAVYPRRTESQHLFCSFATHHQNSAEIVKCKHVESNLSARRNDRCG